MNQAMRIEDHPTPMCDAESFHARPTFGPAEGSEVAVPAVIAYAIERELAECKSQLADMTESRDSEQRWAAQYAKEREHNAMMALAFEAERDEARSKLRQIYYLVEGDADGTVDATPYEKLCNEIAGLTGITL
jgi:hypothetical protein